MVTYSFVPPCRELKNCLRNTGLEENEWWNIGVFLPVLLSFLNKKTYVHSFCFISVNYLRNYNYIPKLQHT
jgi:hypothetical protein